MKAVCDEGNLQSSSEVVQNRINYNWRIYNVHIKRVNKKRGRPYSRVDTYHKCTNMIFTDDKQSGQTFLNHLLKDHYGFIKVENQTFTPVGIKLSLGHEKTDKNVHVYNMAVTFGL